MHFLCLFYVETKIPKHVWFGQVSSGKADVKRLCISGGSAGGYTTLAALAFRDVFKAGASLYGVSTLYYNYRYRNFTLVSSNTLVIGA